jgi:L-ascorbate metabolism protein UlaG (beta-lactamase superfamily)
MKVIYLGHSGFLVETGRAYYLFDYIRGKLPQWENDKPLYIYASHSHEDHFNPIIFDKELADRAKGYVLGRDIMRRMSRTENERMRLYGDKICCGEPGEELHFPDCRVRSFKSTDIGAAFLVMEGDTTIYHAGDMNWWHWEGDTKARNRNMEVNYKREIEHLKESLGGNRINIAFVPLDPRLGEAYHYGMEYFLKTVDTDVVFPMHFWEDYGIIDRYNREYEDIHPVVRIEKEEQEFIIENGT